MTVAKYLETMGTKPLRDRMGLTSQQISHAKRNNEIPAYWYEGITKIADEIGIERPPLSLFKMRHVDAANPVEAAE